MKRNTNPNPETGEAYFQVEIACSQTYGVSVCACACVSAFISSLHLFIQYKVLPHFFRMSVLLKTTATVYRHSMMYSLVFVKHKRFLVFTSYIKLHVIWVWWEHRQVNKILACTRLLFSHYLSFTASFHSFSTSPALLSFPLHSFFLSSDSLSLFPPSLCKPVAQLQPCLGKADSGILSESGEKGEVESI